MYDAKKIQADFSNAALHYDAHAKLQSEVRAALISWADGYIPQKGMLADIGCGTGVFFENPRADLLNIDVAFGMCREAIKKNHYTLQARAEALPIADSCVQGLVSNLMLQWCANPAAVFAEIERILTPGGYAIISTFTEGTLRELQQAFALDTNAHISHFQPLAQLEWQAAQASLEIIKTEVLSLHKAYDSVEQLSNEMRSIGASNKVDKRSRGLMTPRTWRRIIANYPSDDGKIIATWNVGMLIVSKP